VSTSTISTPGDAFRVRTDGPEDAPVLVFSNSLGTTLEMWGAQAAQARLLQLGVDATLDLAPRWHEPHPALLKLLAVRLMPA